MIALDTETTGLYPYKGDMPFCISIADRRQTYFIGKEDLHKPLFVGDKTIAFHNAKFDVAMLLKIGIDLRSHRWHDTKVAARLIRNNLPSYSLDALTGQKDDTVKKYISKHKLYTLIPLEGKKRKIRVEHYDKVPLDILEPYARQDARITYDLAAQQIEVINADPKMKELFEMEMKLLKVVFEMERIGIMLDRHYVEKSIIELKERKEKLLAEYLDLTGESNPQARKSLIAALEAEVGDLPRTEKGNACTDKKSLGKVGGKVATKVLELRDVQMKLGTFFSSYLFLQGNDGAIHPTFDQAGTISARFSSNSPNIQQVTAKEDNIRRCFVPREGYTLVSEDYAQIEYRLLLDLANETKTIDLILKEGLDIHEATARLMSKGAGREITRQQAKTINFSLLYGAGVNKLAASLNVDYMVAKILRETFIRAIPSITYFIRKVTLYAQTNKKIENIYGRVYYLDQDFYKAVNLLIQGSAAEIIKRAMIAVHKRLSTTKSRVLITLHDEILMEIHDSELHLINEVKEIMKGIYKYNKLPMDCSVSMSKKSWGDMEDK